MQSFFTELVTAAGAAIHNLVCDGRTLASASTMENDVRGASGDKTAKARQVGQRLAERAKQAGVEAVVFDRGGNRYHGRVAALAEGAREGGLDF